jgi:hypothetical protein
MVIKKKAKDTLTPVELNWDDTFNFELINGKIFSMRLIHTWGEVISTDMEDFEQPVDGAKTLYRFYCIVEINSKRYKLDREIPSPRSFYQPWEIEGVTIWFDGISDIFKSDGGFLEEKDAADGIYCKPQKKARFAVQDAALEICPEKLHKWLPLPKGGLEIENCYRGEDCWMGPYNGMSAHGGLDINHPVGTPLWIPFDVDDQFYFNSLEMGHNNNRWRGIRKWDNGSVWVIQAHHMTELTVPEHKPLKKGEQFAKGGGVRSGAAHHSHFVFRVEEDGRSYFLDPWILFWKMYRDME